MAKKTQKAEVAPARELTREEIEEKRQAHYALTRDSDPVNPPKGDGRKVVDQGAGEDEE